MYHVVYITRGYLPRFFFSPSFIIPVFSGDHLPARLPYSHAFLRLSRSPSLFLPFYDHHLLCLTFFLRYARRIFLPETGITH